MAKSGIKLKPVIGSGITVSNMDGSRGGGQGIPASASAAIVLHYESTYGSGNVYGPDRVSVNSANAYIYDGTDLYKLSPDLLVNEDSYTPPFSISAFCVDDNYAYLFTIEGDLSILQLSNMTVVGTLESPAPAEISTWQWVYKSGNYVYINCHWPGEGGSGSVLCINVTNPASPSLTSRYRHPVGGGGDIVVANNTLYIGDYFAPAFASTPRFYVVDYTNKAAPSLITTVELAVSADLAFECWRLLTYDNHLYVLDDYIIQDYDISNPTAPVFLQESTSYADVEGAVIIDDKLYHGSSFSHRLVVYNLPAMTEGAVLNYTAEEHSIAQITNTGYNLSLRYLYALKQGKLVIFTF